MSHNLKLCDVQKNLNCRFARDVEHICGKMCSRSLILQINRTDRFDFE